MTLSVIPQSPSGIKNGLICHLGGAHCWWKNNKLHREDAPAAIRLNGTIEYWFDGCLHNLRGPAIQRADGSRDWYINGRKITGDVDGWVAEIGAEIPFDDATAIMFVMMFDE